MAGPGDYLDPNNQMLANWWEAQYGPDYNNFGSQIDYRTNQYGYDYGRYQGAGDTAYGIDNPYATPSWMQYSPEEQNAILREQERYGYMTNPDEYASMYRTPDEQMSIYGDPYAGYNQFQQGMAGMNRDLDFSEQRAFDYLGEQDRNVRGVGDRYQQSSAAGLTSGAAGIRGAVDQGAQGYANAIRSGSQGIRAAANSPDLYLDPGYSGRMNNVLSQGESNVRPIYQNPDLLASQDYMNNYQFTDKDMGDLEALAGTAAGARYRDLQSEIERRAAAGGQTSASALATIKGRLQRQAAQEAADAVLNARTQGRGMQLQTIQGRENTRLGAQQAQANLGTGAELELGQRRAGAETMTEQMRLDAAGRARQMQQAGEGQIMGAQMNAAGDLMRAGQAGESDIMHTGQQSASDLARFQAGNEMALGQSRLNQYGQAVNNRLNVGQFGTQGAAGYQAGGEATSSGRAQNAADTRTDTVRYAAGQRFGQGTTVAGQLSGANQGVADTRLTGGREQRGYLTGMTGLTSQGQLTSSGQRQQQYATRFGAANQAAGQSANYAIQDRQLRQMPKPWERIVTGVLGAAAGIAGSAARGGGG